MDDFSTKKIIKDIEKINKTLASMDKTLALQEANLKEHMRRSDMLERKLAPVEAHVEQVKGIGKFLTYSSLVIAIISGAYALLKYLKGV